MRAKLANQRALLAATGWPAAGAAADQIGAATAALDGALSLDAVRGYEGAGAAAYFGAWRTIFAQDWGFQGRAFHPPPDPINAMLSFGYTLLLHELLTAVQLVGLDPYLGVLHVPEVGRPSLALDLMEIFRPLVVDPIVLELLREGQLRPDSVPPSPQAPESIDIKHADRALLIARYEAAMQAPTRLANGDRTPMRRAVLLQAQAVARVILGEPAAAVGHIPQA